MAHTMTQEMQQCINNCLDCHGTCSNIAVYCLEQGGHYAQASHIKLLLDCAEICQTSANFMLRSSTFHARTCGVCAEICDRCAQECEQMGNDASMNHCAEVCRRCATSCRQMAMAMA